MELLIAATMMSVLFVGLSAHLRGGIAVWQRVTQTTEMLQQQRAVLDRVARDLANTVIYDSRPEAYGADSGKLPRPQFGTSTLAWFTVASSGGQGPAVRFVTYGCEGAGGIKGLWRTSRSIAEARLQRQPAAELLLPDCERLVLQYAYRSPNPANPIVWDDQWQAAEAAPPRLVSVSVQLTSGRQLHRVFVIPVGSLKPRESS